MILPIDGACFCITHPPRSWVARPSRLGQLLQTRDERTRWRLADEREHGRAARAEVEAAVEPVPVLALEDAVPDVGQPARPVEVALVAARRARLLGALRVVRGHVGEPV